jgi:hypothetical protein
VNDIKKLPAFLTKDLPDLSTMDLGGLQNLHSEMLATASDIGYEPPDDVLVELTGVEQAVPLLGRMHEGIRAHVAASADTGKKPVASDEGPSETTEVKKTSKKKAAKPAKNNESTQEAMARQRAAREARDAATPATTKVAKKAKEKTVAKKAAKKKVAKKAAKKSGNGAVTRAPKIDENKKISWIFKGEGNGARPDTERWERRERLRKANGKTVKTYLAGGGSVATLNRAIADKAVSVS